MLHEHKRRMRDELLAGLARMRTEACGEQLSGTSDAGGEVPASLITDLTNAEVARDAAELQDILAAEARCPADTCGKCIDCGAPVTGARLVAYPTAKRCLRCQQSRQAMRAPSGRA